MTSEVTGNIWDIPDPYYGILLQIKFLQRKLEQTTPDCGPSSSQFGAWDACLAITG